MQHLFCLSSKLLLNLSLHKMFKLKYPLYGTWNKHANIVRLTVIVFLQATHSIKHRNTVNLFSLLQCKYNSQDGLLRCSEVDDSLTDTLAHKQTDYCICGHGVNYC